VAEGERLSEAGELAKYSDSGVCTCCEECGASEKEQLTFFSISVNSLMVLLYSM
jgi:hypothetical protein